MGRHLSPSDIRKIDSFKTDGLSGTSNSLAYRVHEIEKHFHSREIWFGEHSLRDAEVDCGERDTMTPFQTDAGNDTWSVTPLCIIGTGDVPISTAYVKLDLHHVVVVDVEATADLDLHKVQLIWGSGTVANAISADQISDIPPFIPERGAAFSVMDVMMPRITIGTDKVWVRHWVDGTNTATMDFFVGFHEYVG
jgi:hypothetical protein